MEHILSREQGVLDEYYENTLAGDVERRGISVTMEPGTESSNKFARLSSKIPLAVWTSDSFSATARSEEMVDVQENHYSLPAFPTRATTTRKSPELAYTNMQRVLRHRHIITD